MTIGDIARSELHQLLSGDAASLFDALMAYLPMGLTIAEPPDVRILRVSNSGLALLGRSRERFEGIPREQHSEAFEVYDTITGRLAASDALPLTRATTRGELVRNEEWLLRTQRGKEITLLCNAGPIRNAEGEVIGGLIAWADISKQKELERELSEAVAAREQLLSELHHRIGNHLHLVGAMLRLEARQCPDVAVLVERMEERLLALGRAYAALRGSVDQVPAAAFLGQICEPLETQLVRIELQADVGVRLSAKTAPTIGIVVNEAICNALKHAFGAGRGCIRVSLSEKDGHMVLNVADNGAGMKAGGSPGGQGQGLMQHLMKGIRGRLEISSAPGRGTSVTASWPV
jgi:PAS domain S-box-containing protein